MKAIGNWLYNIFERRKQRGDPGIVEHFDHAKFGRFEDDYVGLLEHEVYRDGVIDTARLDSLRTAYWHLHEIAKDDVGWFIATKLPWKVAGTVPPRFVYLIELGDFMLAFTIARDPDLGQPIVVALACAIREDVPLEAFWDRIVLPRFEALYSLYYGG